LKTDADLMQDTHIFERSSPSLWMMFEVRSAPVSYRFVSDSWLYCGRIGEDADLAIRLAERDMRNLSLRLGHLHTPIRRLIATATLALTALCHVDY
jgi:hypothetical protein